MRVSAEEDRVDEFNEVIAEAENVDVSLVGTVVSVTNRKGDTSSIDMAVTCENAVKEVGEAVDNNADEIAEAKRSIADVAGLDSYVLPVGGKFAVSDYDNTSVTLSGGTLCLQGKRATRSDGLMFSIASGTAGKYRRDILGVMYTASTGKFSPTVVQGEPASTEAGAADPSYNVGDLLAGDAEAFMPLYRVKLSGVNVGEPEAMFSVLTPLSDLASVVGDLSPKVSALTLSASGWASTTDQTVSGSWVSWQRAGRLVTFNFWIKFKYYQGSYDQTPALATGLPAAASDSVCGVATVDDQLGCAHVKMTPSGELKVERRSQTIAADGVCYGSGVYIAG